VRGCALASRPGAKAPSYDLSSSACRSCSAPAIFRWRVSKLSINQYGNKSHLLQKPPQAMRPTAELVMHPIAVALSAWLSNFLFLGVDLPSCLSPCDVTEGDFLWLLLACDISSRFAQHSHNIHSWGVGAHHEPLATRRNNASRNAAFYCGSSELISRQTAASSSSTLVSGVCSWTGGLATGFVGQQPEQSFRSDNLIPIRLGQRGAKNDDFSFKSATKFGPTNGLRIK
jgi:hypothetical protein